MKELSNNKSSNAYPSNTLNSENFWDISPQEISFVRIKIHNFKHGIEDKLVNLLEFIDHDGKTLWRAKSGSYITKITFSKLVQRYNLESYNLNVADLLRLDKLQKLLDAQKYEALMDDIQWNAKKSLLKSLAKRKNSEIALLVMKSIRGGTYIENYGILFRNNRG